MTRDAAGRLDAGPVDPGRGPWLTCPPGLTPSFWKLVTSVLPGPTDTLFLRACLCRGTAGREAWTAWCHRTRDPIATIGRDPRNVKALVPLLARALKENGVVVDGRLVTYFRAARLTEQLRVARYREGVHGVLSSLVARGIDLIVLKGAAFADVLYDDPVLRHAHDLDLLVREEDLLRAADVLRDRGFRPMFKRFDRGSHHLAPLVDAAGLSVELHRRLSHLYTQIDLQGLWARSRSAVIAGISTRVLSPVDNLLHVAVHTIGCASSRNLRWACDATLLAERLSVDEWNSLAAAACGQHLALPAAIVLGYTADGVGVAVPGSILEHARNAAGATDRIGRSAAACGSRQSLPLNVRGIVRMPGPWAARLSQLLWRLAPPPRHVRWMYGSGRWWPLQYPSRLFRIAVRHGRHG